MERALKQFLAVAEEGSITAACERLHVTQPTITVAIRKLEDDYGVPLFERSSRGMVLTEFGAILFDHARTMARLSDHARAEIQARKSGEADAIRISCGAAWWELFVRDVIRGECQRFPEASVLVEVGSSLDGLSAVIAGEVLAFVGHQVPRLDASAGIRFDPLFWVSDAWFARKGHPLSGRKVKRSEVEKMDVVDNVPIEFRHRPLIPNFGQEKADMSRRKGKGRVLSSTSLSACIDLLCISDAVMTYPAVMEGFFSERGLLRLDVHEKSVSEPVGIYSVNDRKNREAIDNLADALGKAARTCPELSLSAKFTE